MTAHSRSSISGVFGGKNSNETRGGPPSKSPTGSADSKPRGAKEARTGLSLISIRPLRYGRYGGAGYRAASTAPRRPARGDKRSRSRRLADRRANGAPAPDRDPRRGTNRPPRLR